MIHLTRRMALRLVKDNIAVSCIAPGAFASDMNRDARDHADEVAARVPAGRIGNVEDIAGAAIFLASRAGDYVVGSTLVVDGGVTHARVKNLSSAILSFLPAAAIALGAVVYSRNLAFMLLPLTLPALSLRKASSAMPRCTATKVENSVTVILPICSRVKPPSAPVSAPSTSPGRIFSLRPPRINTVRIGGSKAPLPVGVNSSRLCQTDSLFLVLLYLAHRSHFVHAGQAQRQARLTGTAGAAYAVYVHLGVGCDGDVDHRLPVA